jgi:predicted acylesterase/phospholipase RssA
MATSANIKVALAVQGSYGHVYYATGMLDAFRAHNHRAAKSNQPLICMDAGSGCVEMLSPLYFLLSQQSAEKSLLESLNEEVAALPLIAQTLLLSAGIRPDAWQNAMRGLLATQWQFGDALTKLMAHKCEWPLLKDVLENAFNSPKAVRRRGKDANATMTRATEELLMYWSGLPGMLAFSPFFMAATTGGLAKRYMSYDGPTIFSNATSASDLEERYLYYGKVPSSAQKNTMSGTTRPRRVLKMTPEYYFASGARPPYIAPMPVDVEGKIEYWMEGAMRCNPPLTPLIDIGATHIILLRFFSQEKPPQPDNSAQLNDRSMDMMFSIPLQKELESIRLNNHLAACIQHVPNNESLPASIQQRRHVHILDPADKNNPAYLKEYEQFVNDDLNALSHYASADTALQGEMFERGREIGEAVVARLLYLLGDVLSTGEPEAPADFVASK